MSPQRLRHALSRSLGLAGQCAMLTLYPLVAIACELERQVSVPRVIATLGLFALGLFALAALVRALGRFVGWRSPAWWPMLVAAGACANGVLVLLAIHFDGLDRVPWPWASIALGALIAAVALLGRRPAVERALSATGIGMIGLVGLLGPALALPLAAPLAAAEPSRLPEAPGLPAPADARADAPRRIVLVTFDAWRARSTSLVPGSRVHTPALDALAAESTWYANCQAASDATLTAMPVLLSGVPARRIFPHGRHRSGFVRQGALSGLAGYLRPAGYRAYYATTFVRPEFFGMADEYEGGLQAGNLFVDANQLNAAEAAPWQASLGLLGTRQFWWKGPRPPVPLDPGAPRALFEAARQQLAAEERRFVWVHIGAPHTPYFPLRRQGGEWVPDADHPVSFDQASSADEAGKRSDEQLYEAYAAYADQELGRFVRALKADGRWDDTLLVVTADHGEEFVPGRRPHGNGLMTRDVLHVPLLVHAPGQRHASRNAVLCGHVDLAPTILSRVYRRVPTGFVGSDLAGPVPPDRPLSSWGLTALYFQQLPSEPSYTVYRWPFAYRLRWPDQTGELFDWERDPASRHDMAGELPAIAAALRAKAFEQLELSPAQL